MAATLFAYVALIPIIRQSLPPMPGITMVEILTYILTIPNLLTLVSGLIDYTIAMQTWIDNYHPFRDALFLISFNLTIICIILFAALLIGYKMKRYRITKEIKVPKPKDRKIEYRSPIYMSFMKKVMEKRPEIKLISN